MSVARRLAFIPRAVVAIVCVGTMAYCLLVAVPFTYTQFIQSQLGGPLVVFAMRYALFVWAAVASIIMAVLPQLRRRYRDAVALVAVSTAAAIGVTLTPGLAALPSDVSALWIGLAALVPMVWLAAVDVRAVRLAVRWERPADEGEAHARVLTAALASALVVWIIQSATAVLRGGALTDQIVWALPAELVVFGGVAVVCALIRGLAWSSHTPAITEFRALWLAIWAAIAVVLKSIVFSALSFTGGLAVVAAASAAAALTAMWASWGVMIRAASGVPVESGLDVWLNPSGRRRGVLVTAIWLAVVGAIGVRVTLTVARLDWNFLGQMTVAIVIWSAVFAVAYGGARPRRVIGLNAGMALACLPPLGFMLLMASGRAQAADRTAGFDPAFRLVDTFVRPAPAATDADFFAFLQRNTNIPHATHVDPIEISFSPHLERTAGDKPNIFIIVIDSLRRDYVGAVNKAVSFTPAIDAFGRESVVFSNAFTHYGATGLSQPSIWAGSLLLHKQYVTPFSPMNSLEKLVTTEGYRQFVSVDVILRTLFPASVPLLTELDAGRANKDYDLCHSVDELRENIEKARPEPRPMFAYTQPQNIHISTITREGASVPPGESYPGFYAPYASRLHTIDRCFGGFVDYLKASGLYDRSVVVLTADHGDSLGEDGRFGHAYTIYPEIIRIPLIVHAPPAIVPKLAVNKDALVFSTDITPTLFAILGHPPTSTAFPLGRSLLADRPAPGDELIASSYGAVYGLVVDAGRREYVADAVNFRDMEYDLTSGFVGRATSVSDADRGRWRETIRSRVSAIAALYNFEDK